MTKRLEAYSFWTCFGGASAGLLFLIWHFYYPAMVDFPQHAALGRLVADYATGTPSTRTEYHFVWSTPYLLEPLVAATFNLLFDPISAAKLVLSLVLIGYPLSLLIFMKSVCADRWWSLLGFALSFGWCFHWGLLPYLATVPVGIVFLAYVYTFVKNPTLIRAVLVSLFGILLFFSHVMVFAICFVLAMALIISYTRNFRSVITNSLVLVPGIVVTLTWIAGSPIEDRAYAGVEWHLSVLRVLELLASAFGEVSDHAAAATVLLAIVAILTVSLPTLKSGLRPWTPLILLLLAGFMPAKLKDVPIPCRFYFFVLPVVCLAISLRTSRIRTIMLRVVLVALVSGAYLRQWTISKRFNDEAKSFTQMIAHIPKDRAMLTLIFDRGIPESSIPYFLHIQAYYQALRGGRIGYSFAEVGPQPLRLRNMNPSIREKHYLLHWLPQQFNIADFKDFEYFLVRSNRPYDNRWVEQQLPMGTRTKIASQGAWSLYVVPSNPTSTKAPIYLQ